MYKSAICAILVLVLSCAACAPLFPSKKGLILEQQSLVRWHAETNTLDVYAAVANQTDAETSFTAAIVFLNPHLKEAVDVDRIELKEDDRGGRSPFHLGSYRENVLKQTIKTNKPLQREWLSKGVGIELSAQGKRMTLPIKYGEIE